MSSSSSSCSSDGSSATTETVEKFTTVGHLKLSEERFDNEPPNPFVASKKHQPEFFSIQKSSDKQEEPIRLKENIEPYSSLNKPSEFLYERFDDEPNPFLSKSGHLMEGFEYLIDSNPFTEKSNHSVYNMERFDEESNPFINKSGHLMEGFEYKDGSNPFFNTYRSDIANQERFDDEPNPFINKRNDMSMM
jgi:hypothetical protein